MGIDALRALDLPHTRIVELEMIEGDFKNEYFSTSGLRPTWRVRYETSYGEDSLIRSELWLPEAWNGRFVGIGNGGLAGVLRADYAGYSRRGYAVAETDMGTSRLISGEVKAVTGDLIHDYGWRATHIMTVVAKLLIEAYYGRAPEYSYFIGYSAGGKQGFSVIQRFPEDYDGVISGVPSNNSLFLTTGFLWNYVHLTTREGGAVISTAEAEAINAVAVEFFHSHGDGEVGDGFITRPYLGADTVARFITYLRGRLPTLSEGQLAALEAVYRGPVHKKSGKQIYCGYPIGGEVNAGWMRDAAAPRRFGWPWFNLIYGEDFCLHDFDFADQFDRMVEIFAADFCSNAPDLASYFARGGKLLSFSGVADPFGAWGDAAKYYNRVVSAVGDYDTVSSSYRLFFPPGKAHGNEGRGTNALYASEEKGSLFDALVAWCEEGKAPEYLVAAHIEKTEDGSRIDFMRRVYPYRADWREGIEFPPSCDDEYLAIPAAKSPI